MTTNNHPANGPVSLDRLHQIREILSKAAAQSDGGNLIYAMADAVKVIDGVLESIASEQVRCEHAAWSQATFSGVGPVGPLKHLSKELAKLFRKITNSEIDAEGNAHVVLSPADSLLINNARIALASLEAEAVACIDRANLDYLESGADADVWPASGAGSDDVLLYAAPQLPQPAVLSVPDEIPKLKDGMGFKYVKDGVRYSLNYANGWNACRAAMLQSFGNPEQLDEIGSWNNHRNTPTAKPAIDTGELLKSIEGMEVSVDVSTCDADAGHRYFGTVTEISELDTAKNGYILLVQDAKPNFKQAGNSPATPDGWQLVPKEPTEEMNKAGWAAMNEHDAINPTYRAMLAAAPQQEVKAALKHGMQRYAGAMQKLSEGDK